MLRIAWPCVPTWMPPMTSAMVAALHMLLNQSLRTVRGVTFGNAPPRHQGHKCDGRADDEHHLPGQVLGKETADRRRDRMAGSDDDRVDAQPSAETA